MQEIKSIINQIRVHQTRTTERDVDLNENLIAYKNHFVKICKAENPEFEINDQNKDVILNVFNYCMGIQGKLNTKKGLWLWGDIGTGKTTMLRVIRKFDSDIKGRDDRGYNIGGFAIHNVTEICSKYAINGLDSLDNIIQLDAVGIDEIGSENTLTGYYGNQLNIMQYILQRRYDRLRYNITHCTTNMRPEQIAERYGDRIYDRCIEMFNFVEMSGYSFRK